MCRYCAIDQHGDQVQENDIIYNNTNKELKDANLKKEPGHNGRMACDTIKNRNTQRMHAKNITHASILLLACFAFFGVFYVHTLRATHGGSVSMFGTCTSTRDR